MTVLGRDSLITAWMTLIADHTLARGVLDTFARFQGTDVNDTTEEEPGKILHEMRFAGGGAGAAANGDPPPAPGVHLRGSGAAAPRLRLPEHARPSTFHRTTQSFFTLADGALCWIP